MRRLASIVLAKCSKKMLSYMLHEACQQSSVLHTTEWSAEGLFGAIYLVACVRPNTHGSQLEVDSYKSLDRTMKESVKRVKQSKG